jgi:5-methyltetrahydropteroyltriglutamate--homocysteine methyltransferase
MLEALDVPAAAIRNPTCIGRLERRDPLAGRDRAFLKSLTDKPGKITLPGPYLLSRSMWVTGCTDKAYDDTTEMAEDVVNLLRQELIELRDAGASFVQFDEPVLTEVVHSGETKRRTFM